MSLRERARPRAGDYRTLPSLLAQAPQYAFAGNISGLRKINTSNGICFQWREAMIDAVLNAAVFVALALCIGGFGAWAHKRVS
jgi:hypothetical protein